MMASPCITVGADVKNRLDRNIGRRRAQQHILKVQSSLADQ